MQFTTLSIACLSALATAVSAQNAAANAMTQDAAAYTGSLSTTTSTTTSTVTYTVKSAHTITRSHVSGAASATGGFIGSNSTSTTFSPAQPSTSDAAGPGTYEGAASSFQSSQALIAAIGLGAVALVAL